MKCYSAIKKENIWVRSNEVEETQAYYTECRKSEREKPIQYIKTYVWNLERDTDVKKGLLDYLVESEDETIRENSIETCILPYVK